MMSKPIMVCMAMMGTYMTSAVSASATPRKELEKVEMPAYTQVTGKMMRRVHNQALAALA